MSPILPWQQNAWRQLQSVAAGNRLPHAWLLAGSPGTGRHVFANAMAGLLLCEAKTPDGEACGQCAGCQLLAAGHHPDLIRLVPEEDKDQIAVEALREAMSRLALSSHRGGRRILLIEPAEALNDSGVNSLLKTLEEPPAAAHLILIAERLMSLKATLRSRCQILRPGMPTPQQGDAWLKQHQPALSEAARKAFAMAPLDAQAQIEQGAWEPERWSRLLDGLGKALAEITATENPRPCLRWLIGEATQALREQLLDGAARHPLFQRLGAASISDWLFDAAQGYRALAAKSPVNTRLLLESLMIGLYERASTKR